MKAATLQISKKSSVFAVKTTADKLRVGAWVYGTELSWNPLVSSGICWVGQIDVWIGWKGTHMGFS